MHGLPSDFDPRVFVGSVLELVTFAPNAIHVVFGDELSLTATTHLRYRVGSDADLRDDVLPVGDSRLMALLGRRVESAEVRLPGVLILEFEDGGLVSVEDDLEHYESYSLKTPDGEIFV